MYLCVCRAATEKDVRDAIRSGALSLRALRTQLGVCSDCGICAPYLLDEIRTFQRNVLENASITEESPEKTHIFEEPKIDNY